MTAKHTPGPWDMEYHYGGHSITSCAVRIADVDTEEENAGLDGEEAQANARLIAAAPELLAALQSLIKYESLGAYERADARKQARAAIAKATGE